MPNVVIFSLSLFSTIVVSAAFLWWGTKAFCGLTVKIETVFWVSLVTQIYRCVASLGVQSVVPRFPLAGLIVVLCTMVYVQALILRLATGVANQEISWRKAHLISFLTVVVGFVVVLPAVAWLVKRALG